jgi:hypothetical protein
MPKREMMKSTQRYGWKFVCGWLPPAGKIVLGFRVVGGRSVPYGQIVDPVLWAKVLFAGSFVVAGATVPSSACV